MSRRKEKWGGKELLSETLRQVFGYFFSFQCPECQRSLEARYKNWREKARKTLENT